MKTKKVFGLGIGNIMTSLYPASLVDFLVHFMDDALTFCEVGYRIGDARPLEGEQLEFIKKALQKAQGCKLDQYQEQDLPRDGILTYLHYVRLDGIAHPHVLSTVRKKFSQFREVTDLCDRIESIQAKYDPERWENMREILSECKLRDVDYLKRYFPLSRE